MTYKPWMRHPRTTAERRANQEGWERPRRRPHLLPNTYDDLWVRSNKSWKNKRKTQYHTGGRGEHHTVIVPEVRGWNWPRHLGVRDKEDRLKYYFEDHNIPYYIETRRKFRWVERYYNERAGVEDYTICGMTFQRPVYKKVYTGEFYRSWYVDYYIVHWWYDKDIGVDKI